MPVLSESTLLAWFDFGALPITQFSNASNTYFGATDGTLIVGFGAPELRSSAGDLFAAGLVQEGPLGRYSYGRYLKLTNATPEGVWSLSTFGDVNNRAHYVRAAWTLAVVFRPRSVTGNQVLVSRRRSSLSGVTGFSFRLMLSGTSLEGVCTNSSNSAVTLTIASAVAINKTYIAYLSKTDGAALNMGIREVDTGSWLTATGGTQIVHWSATYDVIVNASRNTSDTGNEDHGAIDYSQACWWYSALTPASIQAGIEDHFGIANPAGGGGGGAQASFLSGGGLS